MNGDDNRRAFFRVSMQRLPIPITHFGRGRTTRCWVQVGNLSGGGALLVGTFQPEVGDRMVLHLPGQFRCPPQDVFGDVLWTTEERDTHHIGVQFINLSEAQRDQIVQRVFLKELRSRYGNTIAA